MAEEEDIERIVSIRGLMINVILVSLLEAVAVLFGMSIGLLWAFLIKWCWNCVMPEIVT